MTKLLLLKDAYNRAIEQPLQGAALRSAELGGLPAGSTLSSGAQAAINVTGSRSTRTTRHHGDGEPEVSTSRSISSTTATAHHGPEAPLAAGHQHARLSASAASAHPPNQHLPHRSVDSSSKHGRVAPAEDPMDVLLNSGGYVKETKKTKRPSLR